MDSPYFLFFGTDRPGVLAVRERVRDSHRAFLRQANPHGVTALHGGPTLDGKGRMNGTLLVLRAPSKEAVERFLADDPYLKNDLFERVEIRSWAWALGRPLDDATPVV